MAEIPFSRKYIHDMKELHREHKEKRITDEEFSRRSDELREREAKSHESTGHLLLMQKLKDTEKEIESQVKEEIQQKKLEFDIEEQERRLEHTRQLQRQLREQRTEEQKLLLEQIKRENARNNYRSGINIYINYLESNAQKWQIRYTWLQIILLFFSAITATMAGIDGIPRWIVAFTGVIATIAGSLLTTFKIQDRIYASHKAVAEVKLECQKYDYHIDEYKDVDTENAFIKFSRSITSVQGQQMLQEVELWNPKKGEIKEEKTTQTNIQEDKKPDEISEKPPQEESLSDKDSEEQQNETAQ